MRPPREAQDRAVTLLRRHLLLAALPLPAGLCAAALDTGPLHFPRDHGAHPDSRTEWWYVTGRLAAGGEAFGFQVTFFRSRTPVPADARSRFAAHQLLFAHAALSDLPQHRLRHDQRIARAGFGLAEAATEDTRVTLHDWRLQREAGGAYRAIVRSDSAGFALDLRLQPTQAPMLQGVEGLSRKGPHADEASRYVSEPQLAVQGTLTRDGKALGVQGRAWLDHEWSDAYMAADAVGWDWIGINLDDGGALMAFRMRRRDGITAWSGVSHRAPGQPVRSVEGPEAVLFTPGRTWTSPATGARYPVEWSLQTPLGRFTLRALMDAQELDSRASTGTVYWEGLAELADAASGRRVGVGYLEMTGYAEALKL